ncbi:hypothetical protein C8R45DRAFT_1073629 [Mycena sanguinolenta]|nr:hypothetical protein C8R45DRAFT_1073629 [Mycena sanguinolenta]
MATLELSKIFFYVWMVLPLFGFEPIPILLGPEPNSNTGSASVMGGVNNCQASDGDGRLVNTKPSELLSIPSRGLGLRLKFASNCCQDGEIQDFDGRDERQEEKTLTCISYGCGMIQTRAEASEDEAEKAVFELAVVEKQASCEKRRPGIRFCEAFAKHDQSWLLGLYWPFARVFVWNSGVADDLHKLDLDVIGIGTRTTTRIACTSARHAAAHLITTAVSGPSCAAPTSSPFTNLTSPTTTSKLPRLLQSPPLAIAPSRSVDLPPLPLHTPPTRPVMAASPHCHDGAAPRVSSVSDRTGSARAKGSRFGGVVRTLFDKFEPGSPQTHCSRERWRGASSGGRGVMVGVLGGLGGDSGQLWMVREERVIFLWKGVRRVRAVIGEEFGGWACTAAILRGFGKGWTFTDIGILRTFWWNAALRQIRSREQLIIRPRARLPSSSSSSRLSGTGSSYLFMG